MIKYISFKFERSKKIMCLSYIFRPVLLVCLLNVGVYVFTDSCYDTMNMVSPNFKLLKHRARLDEHIITRKEIPTLEECLAFAGMKKALALNFFPISGQELEGIDRLNCQLLGCPDVNSLYSLIDDEKFNYYSAYSRKLKIGNETAVCLPTIGVFVHIQQPQNYTNAQLTCAKIGGKLANAMSGQATEGLSRFILHDIPIYVGLSNRGKERHWRNEFGHSLDCSGFRRWAQGEPASRGCVALITSKLHGKIRPFWKVYPCSHEFPFLCELLPRHSAIKINKTSIAIKN